MARKFVQKIKNPKHIFFFVLSIFILSFSLIYTNCGSGDVAEDPNANIDNSMDDSLQGPGGGGTPVNPIPSPLTDVILGVGGTHTCAIAKIGNALTASLYCWGVNFEGQVGIGTYISNAFIPQKVTFPAPGFPEAISLGDEHTCAILNNSGAKTLYCWGKNSNGQLGNGNTTHVNVPTAISLPGSPKAISAGHDYTCAITSVSNVDKLYCWGNNSQGQLGLGNFNSTYSTPQSVSLLPGTPNTIAAGMAGTCAISNNSGNKLYCWGYWANLGINQVVWTVTNKNTPQYVSLLPGTPTMVALGSEHTCAVSNNQKYCWGNSDYGQLGIGTPNQQYYLTPQSVSQLATPASIDMGSLHSCSVENGKLRCTGENQYGQLGIGNNTRQFSYLNAILPTGYTALSVGAGGHHTCAVVNTPSFGKQIYCVGQNNAGALGIGANNATDQTTPQLVMFPAPEIKSMISAGADQTCALSSSGAMKCWGDNQYGQLGDGTIINRLTPTQVFGLTSGVINISTAGGYTLNGTHTCAVTTSGAAKCWGRNQYGELGDGTIIDRPTPTQVSSLTSGVIAISVGTYHTCALLNTGAMKCWGSNNSGTLGDGTTINRLTPTQVSGLTSGVAAIATGPSQSCALLNTGAMKCWGSNNMGRLGDGTYTNRSIPTQVSGLTSGITSISVGLTHSCAIANGAAKCWGENGWGELGDGTTTNRIVPAQVFGITSGAIDISAGSYHSCALLNTGAMKCWGENISGQVGDGTTMGRTSPTQVSGLTSGVANISAGEKHTCAVMSTGEAKCWGRNATGQLGDGTTVNRSTPTTVINWP